MNKTLIFLFLILFMITSANAQNYLPHKLDNNLTFSITSNFATSCVLSDINYPSGTLEINQTGEVSDKTFTFFIDGGNYSTLGNYCHNIVCTDGADTTSGDVCREVTTSGDTISGTKIAAYIMLLLFLFVCVFGFYSVQQKVNYEKWYKSILTKYENKNIVKVVLSSMGYNLLKNSFIWYYLLCLPLILLITDITYVFGVVSMIYLMKIILVVYYFGFLLVAVFFFGHVQEWTMQIVEEIKSLDYGV